LQATEITIMAIAIAVTGCFIAALALAAAYFGWRGRRNRDAFIRTLTADQREQLYGFELVEGSWKDFRAMLERQRLDDSRVRARLAAVQAECNRGVAARG
jgi:uncharacterized membrane protein YqiK